MILYHVISMTPRRLGRLNANHRTLGSAVSYAQTLANHRRPLGVAYMYAIVMFDDTLFGAGKDPRACQIATVHSDKPPTFYDRKGKVIQPHEILACYGIFERRFNPRRRQI